VKHLADRLKAKDSGRQWWRWSCPSRFWHGSPIAGDGL